jgi:hypothetical protein
MEPTIKDMDEASALGGGADPEKSRKPQRRTRVVTRDGNTDQIVDENRTLCG